MPLVREVVADELRRLVGRRRRPRHRLPRLQPPPARVAAPPTSPDPWATTVLDYAERMLADEASPRPEGARLDATPFERVDLGLLPDAIAHVVRAAAPVPEHELIRLVRDELMLGELSSREERLLGRFVWSAKGRRAIELREGVWVPGPADSGAIAQLEGRSLDGLAALAGELDAEDRISEDGAFRAMLADLVGDGERAPRIVAVAVEAAIGLARRRGELPADRWGQQNLLGRVDG